MSARISGKVLWWDSRDGYGIIQDADRVEWYCDNSVTPNQQNLKAGDKVTFEHNTGIEAVRCAWKVEVVS